MNPKLTHKRKIYWICQKCCFKNTIATDECLNCKFKEFPDTCDELYYLE